MHHKWGAAARRKRERGEGRALVLKIGQLTLLVSAPRGKDYRKDRQNLRLQALHPVQ